MGSWTLGNFIDDVQMHLPVRIGDFTDFACSKEHLVGAQRAIFGDDVLPPAALHQPIGYNGRASTVVVSGTPIVRPHGQFFDEGDAVGFGPSRQVDYELEVGCIIGKPSEFGEPVKMEDTDEHIFGFVLLNDWSGKHLWAFGW